MSRVCTVCAHPERGEIERVLVTRSASYRDVSGQFALSKSAVSRHVNDGHIAERLSKVRDEEEAREALNVVRQLKAINSMAGTMLQEAFEAEDGEAGRRRSPTVALRAMDRVLKQLEFQAKLGGQLDERPITNVYIGEVVQTAILTALSP